MTNLLRLFFQITFLPAARLLYRPQVMHADRIPETGGVLLIGNHISYIDALLIYGACPRPVRFVIVSRFMKVRAFSWYLKLFGAIPIQHGRPRDAIRATADALRDGDVVCIFPEGQLSRAGVLIELKKGFEVIARQSRAPVIPMFVDGLWESIYSFQRGRYFTKLPQRLKWSVRVAFGEPLAPEEATTGLLRSGLMALSAETFAARGELDAGLAAAAVRALKKRPGATCFIEHGKTRRVLKRGQVLAIAIALADRWKRSLAVNETHIGVFLPSGWMPSLINLALVLAGRVPVNLPFDAEGFDCEKLAEILDKQGIRTVVTSRAFAAPLKDFPWKKTEGQFVDMAGELSAAGLVRVLGERILSWIEPGWFAVRRLGLKAKSAAGELACGYVPGGSTDPVLLSPRTVISNATQLVSANFLERQERYFCEAPLNSAAGTAFALWVPVLDGASCSGRSFANRHDGGAIESIVSEDRLGRVIARRSLLEQLGELPEEWHPELRQAVRAIDFFPDSASDLAGFDQRFGAVESKIGAPVCAGWAPDSMGVVVSLNIPDPNDGITDKKSLQPGRREGSAGRFLPGIAAKTGKEAHKLSKSGDLKVWGACFAGGELVETGWRGRIDAEGFLFLESRADS